MKFVVFIALILSTCTPPRNVRAPGFEYAPPPVSDCSADLKFVLDGTFQNKNLYVQNPSINCTDTNRKFCAKRVVINDTIILPYDSINSSAFEIPLMNYGFKVGDSVHIEIEHCSECLPRVLNPEVR